MLQALAKSILRLSGWKLVGEIPDVRKAVFVAAPHTSNWDGLWFIVYKFAVDVKVRFLGKHTLFWWPLGSFLSAIGCMPVDRSVATGVVPQLVEAFEREERLFLALAPEGTRKWTPHWKTGFYRIARAADVPIYLAFIDYPRKQIGIGPALPAGGTEEEDIVFLQDFYAQFTGRRPELQGPVRFPAEEISPTR